MNSQWIYHPWTWIAVTAVSLFLCTFLPIWVHDPKLRRKVSWFILVPVSIVIIAYVYPVGIEFCKRLALKS